ncbi:MAG TPA: PQQ-dependent dehydrogenase, methanol/ethanol family [Bryobacterales bacterium]|nr:PQQ-dependent dehydrogenase, methanol/ethanol family [Bryobacterales bacterium]
MERVGCGVVQAVAGAMKDLLFPLLVVLVPALAAAQQWTVYGGDLASTRFSPLDQINASNVNRLVVKWMFHTGVPGVFEATPLFEDGVLYFTGPSGYAWALDARTGRSLWQYERAIPAKIGLCCGPVNRGFALAGNRLFLVTIDAHVEALDKKTGQLLWDKVLADYKQGYSATAAPLVVKDKVIVGMAGAEFANRGFVDAYSFTGERLWRLWTIPAPGEPGSETWKDGGDAWKRGGGSTWVTGSYDADLNLLYWGTGNPGPDLNRGVRPGDNLYSNSLLAIDPDTGKLKWHFQFTPHDTHDWDGVNEPVLADIEVSGARRKALLHADRNGFFYALDRANGTFIYGFPYIEQTWAKGLDASGRPIPIPGLDPTKEGTVVCPGLGGGKNWNPMAYNPQTHLVYVPSFESCEKFSVDELLEPRPFLMWMGSVHEAAGATPAWSALRAFDANTGKRIWEFKATTAGRDAALATAGDLVFSGDAEGYFTALHARTGKVLWRLPTGILGGEPGRGIAAPAVTYLLDGKQQVAVVAGSSMFAFQLIER